MADPRFATPAASPPPPRFGPEKPATIFQAEPGAFEALYGDMEQPEAPKTQQKAPQPLFAKPAPKPIYPDTKLEQGVRQGPPTTEMERERKMRSLTGFGSAKEYFDQAPLPRFVEGVKRYKEKTADRIQQYVEQHPEDRDLLRPAPLSSWAKDIGIGLAKLPLRVAQGAAKIADFVDPFQRIIPDSMLKIPKVEDSVLRVAAYVGLPLEEAQETAKEKPGILQSLHDGFVVPIKDGFQIATMPDGPEKQEAFDAWAYKTSQAFTSGLTVGVVDQAVKENSVWLENGELMWRGVPITELTELENKGVAAGQLTGQLGGSLVTYALVSPMLTAQLRSVPALNELYKAHPYLSSAILTNAAEEGFESIVRKATGQSYTFNDTLIGMLSGAAFETGKLTLGGYRPQLDTDIAARPSPELDNVRGFLEGEVRAYTLENGHVPDLNDLRARIGDKVVPGTNYTINDLHTMLAQSGFKEARLIEMKGGKKGRPGMDYSAEPPKPEADEPSLADISPNARAENDAMAAARVAGGSEADILAARNAAAKATTDMELSVSQLRDAQAKYEVGGGTKEQFKTNKALKSDPEAPKVIAESRGRFMQEPPEGEVATRYVHFDELHDIVKKGMLDPAAHGSAATKNTLGFDISSDLGAVREAGLFNPKNGPVWKVQTALENVRNPSEIVLTGGKGVETNVPVGIDKLYIEGPGFETGKPTATTPPSRFSQTVSEINEGQAKPGKVKQVFRTDKFNVDEAGQARLKQVQTALGLETRGVRSWKDVEAAARDIGADPNQLMRRVEGKTQLSDAEVEALRQNVGAAHEFLVKKYDLIEEARARGDKAAVMEIEQKARVNEEIINSSVKKLIGGGTELGRGVAIYRKIAALKMDDPTYFYKEAMKLLDDGRKKVRFLGQKVNVEDGKLPAELREAIDSLMKSKDQVGLAYLMSQLKRTNNWDKVVHLWKAGLLTSPTTDLANILSNTTMMALATVKDVPATVADILISKGAKTVNRLFGTKLDEARVKTASLGMMKAQLEGLYEGAKHAKRFMQTGIDPDDLMAKYDVRGQINYNNAFLQGYTDFIFRKLGAEDLVFRYGFIRKSLMESAQLKVVNMDNAAISAAIKGLPEGRPKTKAELVRQFYLNPSDDASVRAINSAEYGTFQRKNPVSQAISGAKRSTTPGGRAALEFIAPFTTTPTNIGFTIFDYTPVGFATELAMQLKNPNKLKLVESFGRGAVGTSVIALGSMLAEEGLMTGNAPSTESERKLWEAERKQPNSIFFMGKWRKLDRVSPLGNLLTIGAEFNELGRTKTTVEQWTQIGFEGIKSVTEQSFLLGFSNALKAITEPDRFAETFVENAIRGMVPNIIARVAQGADKYERDVGRLNPIAVLQERIPILRESLPAKQDVLGRDIKTQGGMVGRLFDPFSSKKPSSDPVVQELSRLQLPVSAPNRALYSDEEFNALIDMRGRTMMQVFNAAMNDPEYQSLPDDGKREVIKQIDAAVTRGIHDQFRMASAQRIRKELSTMSASDRQKKLAEIKKKNNTVYTLIELLDATDAPLQE